MKIDDCNYAGIDNSMNPNVECPNCKEKLTRFDVEFFAECPFCDYTLVSSYDMDDFILQPAIDFWARKETIQNMQGSMQPPSLI